MESYAFDKIVVTPQDIDLAYSPLQQISEATYVLGAFNPGFTRLPNGNLLLVVRVAEALRQPIWADHFHTIRWDQQQGFTLDAYPLAEVDVSDPRKVVLKKYNPLPVFALTSYSWLLPIELDSQGKEMVNIHYDKIIAPQRSFQEYGIEDARISYIEGTYYLTACGVSSERHATILYSSDDGLNYKLEGLILDHQNKDMLLFEGKVGGKFYALTRPLGNAFFAPVPNSTTGPGPSINLAASPDGLHWKPLDHPFLRPWQNGTPILKLGGGSQPILTDQGWLMLFHSVEEKDEVGLYQTFWALLDQEHPEKVLHLETKQPVLRARPSLTEHLKTQIYLHDVVFTTGIVESGDHYLVASGELDLCCRLTRIPKSTFWV